MCGASIEDIIQRIFFEIVTIVFVSFCLFIFTRYVTNEGDFSKAFKTKDLLYFGITTILITLGISIIPIMKVQKLDLNSVLKED